MIVALAIITFIPETVLWLPRMMGYKGSSPSCPQADMALHSEESRMDLPQNQFKRALAEGRQQIGLWCSLPGAYVAEAVAGSGFDWLLFDTEHSPGDPLTVMAQLQAVAPYPVSAVVRPASQRRRADQALSRPRRADAADPLCSERR